MTALRITVVWQLALVGLVCGRPAWGYDAETHRDISENAFNQSVVSTYLPGELGIDSANPLEHPMGLLGGSITQPPVGWVRQGATDEDDNLTLSRDPVLARYRHHFYNPLDGSGLHFRGVTGMPAPVWGIEFQPISGQDFSFTDARQYFYQALTAPDPKDREQSLARTFLTLGHVIHLIQDSAQPQHTRNDSHGPWPFGGRSFYESYTEQNHAGLPFDGYAPVYGDDDTSTFNFIYDFWHRAGGMGLADYSNRGFVSARTNFRITDWTPLNFLPNVNFPKPDNDGATIEPVAIEDLLGGGTNLVGDVDFIATPVIDSYRPVDPPEVNHRTSSYSIFDPDLEHYNKWVTHITDDGTPYQTRAEFNLNRFNFEAAWPFLIPRAVGYSAGLINYFFRGRIDFAPDPDDLNGYLIKNLGPEDLNGTFELYYDDADGNRQLVPGANQWQLPIPAAAHCPNGAVCNQASVQAFDVPFDAPLGVTYTLVFHGTMGNEAPSNSSLGAVAGKSVQGSSFMLLTDEATYRSAILDHGWRRIGDGLPVPSIESIPLLCNAPGGCQGGVVSKNTLFFDSSAFGAGFPSSCTDTP